MPHDGTLCAHSGGRAEALFAEFPRTMPARVVAIPSSFLMTQSARYRLPHEVDCVVLGGGITGAGIARDAALRGLRVLLIDSHDFASGTSQATSKLIHGGFRYLQHGRVRLVVEGIVERNRLLNNLAPHLSTPIKFVVPFEGRSMPLWAATSAVLHLYDLIGLYRCGGRSGGMMGTTLRQHYPALLPHPFGVRIWDAQTNDVRMVMAALRSAEIHGAVLSNYTTVRKAELCNGGWRMTLAREGEPFDEDVYARAVINATGPWSSVTADGLGATPPPLMWLKGTHLVVRSPRHFGRDAIIFRSVVNHRPLWAIPWEGRLLIGTTETRYAGDPRNVRPTTEEVSELLTSFHHWFPGHRIPAEDLISAFAGIRPIVDQEGNSENKLSREHEVETDSRRRLITVRGGKLTTFRLMAEQAVSALLTLLGRPPSPESTLVAVRRSRLWPGAPPRLDREPFATLVHELRQLSFADDSMTHLVRHFGADAGQVLSIATADPALAARVCPDQPYTLAECLYLADHEHVRHLVDLVRRRTTLYLLLGRSCPSAIQPLLSPLAARLGWSPARVNAECTELHDELNRDLAALHGLLPPAGVCEPRAECA